jgi:hypothetical protein
MGIWHQIPFIDWLVVLNILKNMKVNGKDDNPYYPYIYNYIYMKWKIILPGPCLKPPTR